MSTSSNIVIPCLHHAINASMSGSFHASVFGVFGNDSNLQVLQAVIGSAPSAEVRPKADGNFDRNNNFRVVITDGESKVSNVSLAMLDENAGQAAHTVRALKCEPSFHDAFDIVIAACLYLQQHQYSHLFPVCIIAAQDASLTLSDRMQAQFCHDVATLQPPDNPLATFITGDTSGPAASPASAVVVFDQAFGCLAKSFGE